MNTETEITVGHKTLRLRDLNPEKSDSYSTNLYRWMTAHAHFFTDGGVLDSVYRVKPGTRTEESFGAGTLMLGYPINGHPGDTDFSGIRLTSALCNGRYAGSWCFAGMAPDLTPVVGFWDNYLLVGRCAIDPMHSVYFSGKERYLTEGNKRKCLWCGCCQTKVVTPRTVYDESWV